MCAEQSDSFIKKALMSLCCDNGWSYGVFWGFSQTNSLLLTMEDAYYDEQMVAIIDDMLLQVHMLGGGIIGQAAFTKKHWWMSSDQYARQNSVGSIGTQIVSQDDSEFHHQFASGIKTIAIIPIGFQGVLHFGSTLKILERAEFVNQAKRIFGELNFSENAPLSLSNKSDGSSGSFDSLILSQNTGFLDPQIHQGTVCQDLTGTTCSSVNPIQPLSITSDHSNRLQSAGTESQFMVSDMFNTSQQNPCSSTWSSGDSTSTSFTSLHSSRQSTVSLTNQQHALSPHKIESKLPEGPTSLCTFTELFDEVNYTMEISNLCPMDSFSQWFAPSLDQGNDIEITTTPSNLNGWDSPRIIPVNHSANSMESSITNTSCSNGKEKCSDIIEIDHHLFNTFEKDFGCREGLGGNWDEIFMPVINGCQLDSNTNTSECISEQRFCSTAGHREGLFSTLGIEQLIDSFSGTSSSVSRPSVEDQSSSMAKRKRTGSSLRSSLPIFGGKSNSFQPVYDMDKMNNVEPKKNAVPKSDAGSWISSGYPVNAGSNVLQHKKLVGHTKATKRKAKPGAKPEPKDRQQIRYRLAELRKLIPNGEKMSIDNLLNRSIKYMLFLQSVTKHADTLKQADEEKKDCSSSRGGGVTWACEFGDQSMVCPLIVEDLTTPGQMLIEMLYEEQGFFLEIVDIIRGFNLTILKGVMEVRESKLWARFTVESEGNRRVTRHEIFSALIQLLQVTAPSGVNLSEQLGNVISGSTNLVNNYQKPVVPLPVSLAETLQNTSF